MAKETRSHLLVVDYDEDQGSLLTTFGVTSEEITEFLNGFIRAANENSEETFSARLMNLIDSGKVSGGMILALATQSIMSILESRRVSSMMKELLSELLRDEKEEDEESSDN